MRKAYNENYTVDLKFLELCDEIDHWKNVAQKEREEAEYWRTEYNSLINGQLKRGKEMVGTMLTGLLDGNFKAKDND